MTGTLYVVATPIGNLEDMTYRAVRVLGQVELIAAEDTRSAGFLLKHYGISGAKLMSVFEGNEAMRAESLVAALQAGKDVALVSEAGTPGVSDPGQRVIAAAIAASVRVEVLPGATAAITALVGSGLPSERFTFVGFLPRAAGARRELLGSLRSESSTLIFYEAPDRVVTTLEDLAAAFGNDRRASIGRELTKFHEEYLRGSLAELHCRYSEQPARGEHVLVVAGASADAQREAIDIEAELRVLLEAGLGPKDAAQRLVVRSGKPRRQLYQLALSLQRKPRQ